jgi:hypothetical protein
VSLRVSLDPVVLTVEAGRQATCTVTVHNTSRVIERYTLAVVGPTSRWASMDPASISLLPDAERTVTLSFRPPRQPVPNAGTFPFGVRVVPAAPSAEAVVEEGDISVEPFIDLVPALSPHTSRSARAGRHRLRLTNAGNVPVEADITASDPDELLKLRVYNPHLTVAPGATESTRVVARPRQLKGVGAAEPRPFAVQISPTNAAVATISGTLLQRPLLPKWLPRALIAVALLALGTVLYANHRARISDIASISPTTTTTAAPTTLAPTTTIPPTTTTTPPPTATTTPGGSTTTPTSGSTALFERGLTSQQLTCFPYDNTSLKVQPQSPSTTTAPAATGTTAPTQNFEVSTNNPRVDFIFASLPDAQAAYGLLFQESQVCYIGFGGLTATQTMVLEPNGAPSFPKVPGTTEKCLMYNNSPGTLVTQESPTPHLVDLSTGQTIQRFQDDLEMAIGLKVAQAHTQRCWVGSDPTFSSLQSHDGTSILEYWR